MIDDDQDFISDYNSLLEDTVQEFAKRTSTRISSKLSNILTGSLCLMGWSSRRLEVSHGVKKWLLRVSLNHKRFIRNRLLLEAVSNSRLPAVQSAVLPTELCDGSESVL